MYSAVRRVAQPLIVMFCLSFFSFQVGASPEALGVDPAQPAVSIPKEALSQPEIELKSLSAAPEKEEVPEKKKWKRRHAKAKPLVHPKFFIPQTKIKLPNDQYGEMVRYGQKIFTDTQHYASRYVGNSLSCQNCHLDAGQKPNASPMWAAFGMYPAYSGKTEKVETFEERLQQCFKYSMNGFTPSVNSKEIMGLTAYASFLAKGAPIGTQMPGRGFPTIPNTGLDPNPQRGQAVYSKQCVVCHGDHGQGQKDAEGSTTMPPLWGFKSYNKGAGLFKINLMAGFLKANMPLGNAHLSDQDSLDLASWINLQERPADPRKGLFEGLMQGGSK